MQSIKPHPILTFNPDTLMILRQQYNFEKPGEMDAAIDLLEDWIKKQEHFTKKEYRTEDRQTAHLMESGNHTISMCISPKDWTLATNTNTYLKFVTARPVVVAIQTGKCLTNWLWAV